MRRGSSSHLATRWHRERRGPNSGIVSVAARIPVQGARVGAVPIHDPDLAVVVSFPVSKKDVPVVRRDFGCTDVLTQLCQLGTIQGIEVQLENLRFVPLA
jgi:hypothetical protein